MVGFEALLETQETVPDYYQKTVENRNTNIEFINNVTRLIEKNIEDSAFDLHILIDKFHMSQSSLFKKIKRNTGLSPSMFIRSLRLKKAASVILNDDYKNLTCVALDVGFNDYRYFKRSFKKYYGCLPSEYKESILSKMYSQFSIYPSINSRKCKQKTQQLLEVCV